MKIIAAIEEPSSFARNPIHAGLRICAAALRTRAAIASITSGLRAKPVA